MNNLQRLLDERYPESEISHIQRQAFIEGYNAWIEAAEKEMIEEGYQKPSSSHQAMFGE